jgi:hypothetical protein
LFDKGFWIALPLWACEGADAPRAAPAKFNLTEKRKAGYTMRSLKAMMEIPFSREGPGQRSGATG